MYRVVMQATKGEQIVVSREFEVRTDRYERVSSYLTVDLARVPKGAAPWMRNAALLHAPDEITSSMQQLEIAATFRELEAKFPGMFPQYAVAAPVEDADSRDDYEEMYDRAQHFTPKENKFLTVDMRHAEEVVAAAILAGDFPEHEKLLCTCTQSAADCPVHGGAHHNNAAHILPREY